MQTIHYVITVEADLGLLQHQNWCALMVNGFQSLTIITKRSILDVAAVLDPFLTEFLRFEEQRGDLAF